MEDIMWKTVLAGTTALAIAGASLAYAAQPGKSDQDRAQRWRPTAEDITALGDARIAALKAGLKLTPDQEKHWPAMEEALRGVAKQRADRHVARSADRPSDPIERLAARAESIEARGAALKKLAGAAAPLYGSLDESQKRRFMMLAHLGGKRFGHWRGDRDHRGGHGWHHRGPRERGPERGPQPQ
jgi:hypothetical protein